MKQDSSGDEEDEDLDLESPFSIVIQAEVEETVAHSEQIKRIVDRREYAPRAEIFSENPDGIQQCWKMHEEKRDHPLFSGQS